MGWGPEGPGRGFKRSRVCWGEQLLGLCGGWVVCKGWMLAHERGLAEVLAVVETNQPGVNHLLGLSGMKSWHNRYARKSLWCSKSPHLGLPHVYVIE